MLSERTESAMQFAIFADLPPPEFELVIEAASEKRFAPRETIFTQGDPLRQVTLVVSGFVKF